MSRAESYQALAALLAYPEEREKVLCSIKTLRAYLDRRGVDSPVLPFVEFAHGATLGGLQEDYVATFDFDPSRAPYLGHHLYGDHQKRAAYLIKLKGTYAGFSFQPEGCELPDHLSVLLGFLAHLSRKAEDEARRKFIEEEVLPGVRRLGSEEEARRSRWLPLIETAELLMSTDCKEG